MKINSDYTAELFLDTATGLYDLSVTTFNGAINTFNINTFLCNRKHNARLDLVCFDIYNTSLYIGTLSELNSILNPFSVKDGDVIFYLPENDLSNLLTVPETISQIVNNVKNDFINSFKQKKPDFVRKNYLSNRTDDKLPPTILKDNTPQIVLTNNSIKLSPTLFNNNSTNITTEQVDNATQNNITSNITQSTNDEFQRVLVKRFIQLANQ